LGLRYWTETDEEGEDEWFFECKLDNSDNSNDYDEKVFWLS